MSDEAHIEAARRHAERPSVLPWAALAPDEQLMQLEEAGARPPAERADVWERVLVSLFADGEPERWENVALRALALIRHCVPSLLVDRKLDEAERVKARAGTRQSYQMTEFLEACEDEAFRDMLRAILDFLFPDGPEWIREGCKRLYLVARSYQPWLVEIWKTRRETVYLHEVHEVSEGRGGLRRRRVSRCRRGSSARARTRRGSAGARARSG